MADIELVIKISEEAKQAFDCAESNDLKGCYYDHGGVIGNAIKNGVPLSNNATNGDVIKALFPDGSQVKGASIYVMNDNKSNISYDFDWWNAPYKVGDTDESN